MNVVTSRTTTVYSNIGDEGPHLYRDCDIAAVWQKHDINIMVKFRALEM